MASARANPCAGLKGDRLFSARGCRMLNFGPAGAQRRVCWICEYGLSNLEGRSVPALLKEGVQNVVAKPMIFIVLATSF